MGTPDNGGHRTDAEAKTGPLTIQPRTYPAPAANRKPSARLSLPIPATARRLHLNTIPRLHINPEQPGQGLAFPVRPGDALLAPRGIAAAGQSERCFLAA